MPPEGSNLSAQPKLGQTRLWCREDEQYGPRQRRGMLEASCSV